MGLALKPGRVSERLKALGVTLPNPATPAGNYVPWVRSGNIVFLSGQGPVRDGTFVYVGKVGVDLTVEDGRAAARLAAENAVAHLAAACDGDLDRVQGVVKFVGFVNVEPGFGQLPKVLDGTSDFLTDIFGASAKHARCAIGVAMLPSNLAFAADLTFVTA
ncbi:MAG: RidA family protein [Alphaproteobacteria bacterium]